MTAQRLFNRNFVLLWQGQLVSQLGSQAFMVAMLFWLKRDTGSASIMGSVMMVSMLPLALMAPFGGAIADRISRKTILVACDLVSGAAVLTLAGILFRFPDADRLVFAALVAAATVTTTARALFTPAARALLPSLVPQHRVAAANSINEGSSEIAVLVGQGIGGVLFRVAGAPLLFLIDGISYVASGISEIWIREPSAVRDRSATFREVRTTIFRDTREGVRHVLSHPSLRNLVIVAAAINVLATPLVLLLPFYVEDVLGAPPDWFGYLLAGLSAGTLAGYAIAARCGGALWVAASAVALPVAVVALGWNDHRVVALILMLAAGVCQGVFHVGTVTRIQQRTDDALRGRVFGVLQALALGLAPVAMLASGVAADLVDQDVALLFRICGVLMLCVAVAGMRSILRFLTCEIDN